MSTITFENGKSVTFDGTPTQADIEEVAKSLGVGQKNSGPTGTSFSSSHPILSGIGNIAGSIGGFLSNVGQGAGAEIGNMATNIANIPIKLATGGKTEIPNIYKDQESAVSPGTKLNNTVGGNIGKLTADTYALAQPTGVINKGKTLTEKLGGIVGSKLESSPTGNMLLNNPIGKALSFTTQKVLNAIPEAIAGFGFGKTQGETNNEALGTAAGFGLASGLGEVAGDTYKKVYKGLFSPAKDLEVALGQTSIKGTKDFTGVPTQQLSALKLMSGLSDDVKIQDQAGVQKAWEPTKDGLFGTAQAIPQIKQKIFDAYNELALKAGEGGVRFTRDDFSKLEETLAKKSKGTFGDTPEINAAAQNMRKSLLNTFGEQVKNPQTGEIVTVMRKDIDPKLVQDYLKNLIDNVGDATKASEVKKVSLQTIDLLNEALDKKIAGATGGQYKEIRKAYSDIKSIEDSVVKQFKRFGLTGEKGLNNYLEQFGALQTFTSMLQGDVAGTLKGVGLGTIGKWNKYQKNPSAALTRLFKTIEGNPARGPGLTRVLGKDEAIPNTATKLPSIKPLGIPARIQ